MIVRKNTKKMKQKLSMIFVALLSVVLRLCWCSSPTNGVSKDDKES